MDKWTQKKSAGFNAAATPQLNDYTIVLTKPDGAPDAQAAAFAAKLDRWLHMHGDAQSGTAKAPVHSTPGAKGNAQVTITCSEAVLSRIERQFAGDILETLPPPEHARGTIYPPKVDPFDVRFW
ncbi:MAG: hypothetical protein PW788_11830 [Micavibrio sp.]|nr:hypothetical protein [Micavibrio sp.]